MNLNKSVLRSISILTALANSKKAMTLTEISKETGIPKSTAIEILYTMVEKEFVKYDNKELKTYKLGLALFQIGSAAVKELDITSAANEKLEKLLKSCGQTVYLAVEQGKRIVYILRKDGEYPVKAASGIGEANDMYYTSIGKAILAGKSPEDIKKLYGEGPYDAKTKNTITTYEALLDDLKKTRERGYAIDNREGNDLIYCFGAPILNYDNEIVAAISLVFFYPLYDENKTAEYTNALILAAREISKELGYRGTDLYHTK